MEDCNHKTEPKIFLSGKMDCLFKGWQVGENCFQTGQGYLEQKDDFPPNLEKLQVLHHIQKMEHRQQKNDGEGSNTQGSTPHFSLGRRGMQVGATPGTSQRKQ